MARRKVDFILSKGRSLPYEGNFIDEHHIYEIRTKTNFQTI